MGADFKLATTAANDLLKKYAMTRPPIDPELIAEEEGVRVLYAQFEPPADEKTSGFFRLQDKSILVNEEISRNRITFTIAHELAHFVLHQDFIKSNDYIPMPRYNEYDGEKPKEEIEADFFAASLLVPLKMLKTYVDIATVDELSNLFFVSRDVISNRLDLLERYPAFAK